MLGAQVVEDGDVEDAAVDAAEHQGVAGDLHGHGLDAAFAHDREEGLEVGGLGGGPLGLDALVADAHLDGADQSGAAVRRAQAAFDEVRRGGLAGGSGDADLEQALAGVAVDRGGELAHPAARVGDDQDRQAGRSGALGAGGVGQHGGGAEARGLRGEVGAVGPGSLQGRVEVSGADRTGVVRDPGDLRSAWRRDVQQRGQLAQRARSGGRGPGRSRRRCRGVLLGGSGLISVGHGGERTGRGGRAAK